MILLESRKCRLLFADGLFRMNFIILATNVFFDTLIMKELFWNTIWAEDAISLSKMLLHPHFTEFTITLKLNSISFLQKHLLQKWNACRFTDILIILFYVVFRNSGNWVRKALEFNAYIQHYVCSTILHAMKMEHFYFYLEKQDTH